jgi:hypothetical protein
MMSPIRLIVRRAIASQYPQRAPRHRPVAANAQAIETAHIRTIAHAPILAKPSRARGLSRHSGSRKLPGKSSDTKETKLAAVPNKKKMLRAVIPTGRVSELVVILLSFRVRFLLVGLNPRRHHLIDSSRPLNSGTIVLSASPTARAARACALTISLIVNRPTRPFPSPRSSTAN